ncbi:MAG: 50S ribosomal protein L13, partial [Caldicoprobacterales bacterium]
MKTFMAKAQEVERKWYVVDADGKTLGRLASEVAKILRGKHKPIYTPHVDTGDHVIVINAEKIVLTGKKLDQKLYRRHSQYPGGLKEIPYRHLMETRPTEAIYKAVKGM